MDSPGGLTANQQPIMWACQKCNQWYYKADQLLPNCTKKGCGAQNHLLPYFEAAQLAAPEDEDMEFAVEFVEDDESAQEKACQVQIKAQEKVVGVAMQSFGKRWLTMLPKET